ncbi:MAG: hypothetical protein KAQ93_05330 [Spirochaetales bacterium]|nr:hypothetical protein [Spirochaetales bacterium]
MKRNIIFTLIIGLSIIAISSCGLAGTSMSDRISYFEDDLNGSRTNIIDNIHPDASSYNTLNDTFWTLGIWTSNDQLFSITSISEGSKSITAVFNSSGVTLTNAEVIFGMKDDGDFFSGEDWKIMSCVVNGGTQF